jgi:FtsP/CotA-like multicopper oxidase with cupredoxin domain
MGRRTPFLVCVVTFLTLFLAGSALAQAKKKTTLALPAGAVEQDGVIIPGCTTPSQLELVEPAVIEADQSKHELKTTLDVKWNNGVKVPVYKFSSKGVVSCSDFTFDLRNYVDPTDGKTKFPGPTLKVKRAAGSEPGDRLRVTLQNHLGTTDERCVWAKGNCFPDANGNSQCTNPPAAGSPQCCKLVTQPVGMNCFHGDSTTNLHFHGTHASPQKPQDWVMLQLQPFQPAGSTPPHAMGHQEDVVQGEFEYNVDPLPANQAEGTHWYHPHKHGSTAEQVGNGMAGALIVTGPFDAWLNGYYEKNKGVRERLLIVQQVHDLNFDSLKPAGGGSVLPLINGQLVPKITMYRNEVQRWRLISATMEASAQIVVDFNGVKNVGVDARQIAMDGVQFSPNNYYCQPLIDATPCDGKPSDLQFRMSPGNRADFLVKAPNQLGRFMVSYDVFGALDTQGKGGVSRKGRALRPVVEEQTLAALAAAAPGPTQPALLVIQVDECPAGQDCNMDFPAPTAWPALPGFLRPIKTAGNGQDVQFQINPSAAKAPPPPAPDNSFAIYAKGKNGDKPMQFNESCAAFTEPIDPNGGEEWRLSQNIDNPGGKPLHVFHLHTNPFQLVSTYIGGKKVSYDTCPPPAGQPSYACMDPIWHDSVTLPDNNNAGSLPNVQPSAVAVIRQRFEDFTGAYVIHCHFLGHEDRGMMVTIQTVCPQNGMYSETSTSQPECSFGKFLPALPDIDSQQCKAATPTSDMMQSMTHERMKKH